MHWDGISDDRVLCRDCARLAGPRCDAARTGEVVASRQYEPEPDRLRRCEGFVPRREAEDQRTGLERWPGLVRYRDVKKESSW